MTGAATELVAGTVTTIVVGGRRWAALAQIDLDREAVAASIQTMAARRRHPPMTAEEVVESLSRSLPEAMARLPSDG